MGRAIDRLPTDFAELRAPRVRTHRSADMQVDHDPTLAVPARTPDQAAERRAAALARLEAAGAADLAEMLGLTDPPRVEVAAVDLGPLSVPCPQCQMPVGRRCESRNGDHTVGSAHRGRQRRAETARAVKTNERLTKESA